MAPLVTVSMSKMLPQTYNQCSKVDVKHGKWFWCEICDIHVKNLDDRDFMIGRWGEHKSNGGHKKVLVNEIAIADLNKRGKAGDVLKKKEKKHLNSGNKSNTLPLTDFFFKKSNNSSGCTTTSSATEVANGLNAKTALVTFPTCRHVRESLLTI